MARVQSERLTAVPEEGFVLFLIGMRFNNLFAVHRWLPVFLAMPRMLKELYINSDLGFKSHEMWVGRTLILVQYWESSEKLIQYAKGKDSEHLPAWRAFNQAAMKSSAVGIWHETYVVDKGKTENVYVNMPKFGFGKVGKLVPAQGKRNSAERRLSGE
ncbi:MAG: DUF4188 domain-containing protein [Microbacteriaceae bacterium]|nr:DUF4188 domain-containing protein [Microbacteriaceae bacterium]